MNGGWPFVEAEVKAKNFKWGELNGPFHISGHEDCPLYFYAKENNASDDGWRATAGSGRIFGGSEHDYMLIPAIEGYRLVEVYIVSAKQVSYAITNNPASGTPTPISGGEVTKIAAQKSHTFTLSGTLPNTEYRIDLPVKDFAKVAEIKLTYEQE